MAAMAYCGRGCSIMLDPPRNMSRRGALIYSLYRVPLNGFALGVLLGVRHSVVGGTGGTDVLSL